VFFAAANFSCYHFIIFNYIRQVSAQIRTKQGMEISNSCIDSLYCKRFVSKRISMRPAVKFFEAAVSHESPNVTTRAMVK